MPDGSIQERKLRIGVDASPLGVAMTGVGNYVSTLLQRLCAHHPDAEFYLYSNRPVHFDPFPHVFDRSRRSRLRGPLWHSLALPAALRKDQIDVFWGTNGMMPLRGLAGIGTVLTIHDLAEIFAPETQKAEVRWSRRISQPLGARRADRVVVVSASTGLDLEARYRRRPDAVVHPIVSERFRRPARAVAESVVRRHKLPGRYLLTVGTFEPRKNLRALMHAYISVRAQGIALPLLVLAGGNGWLSEETEQLAVRAEHQGFVRRLGFVSADDLPALYACCEAFLMPSSYEGFGMPVLEAQLCGAPVVHGAHASMREASGNLGVPVETSEAALAEALRSLADGTLPLSCRVSADIHNDVADSADSYWRMLLEANSIRHQEGM